MASLWLWSCGLRDESTARQELGGREGHCNIWGQARPDGCHLDCGSQKIREILCLIWLGSAACPNRRFGPQSKWLRSHRFERVMINLRESWRTGISTHRKDLHEHGMVQRGEGRSAVSEQAKMCENKTLISVRHRNRRRHRPGGANNRWRAMMGCGISHVLGMLYSATS